MMPDRKSVITHLQIIHTWASFARERDLQFFTAKHLEDIAKWSDDAIELLKEQEETIDTLYSILNDVCKDVREETEGDHVCGLCEYDGAHKTDSGDWAGECPGFESADCFCMKNEIRKLCGKEFI